MAKVWNGIQIAIRFILMLLIGAAIVAYLFNGNSSGADWCPGALVPNPLSTYECVPRSESIEAQATIERKATLKEWERQGRIDDATRQAELSEERDEEYRREMEEAREDAIRSCILDGNHPDLCELDPGDPYGTGEQR